MLRTKRVAAALILAVLTLSSCGKEAEKGEALIYENTATNTATEGYKTIKPEKGTYIKTANFEGSMYFPNKEEVVYTGSEAVLKKICVSFGDEVKAGDIIAEIEVIYDELDLKKLELDIKNAENSFEAGLKAFDDSKEGKARKELYILENSKYLDMLKKSLADFNERISVKGIYAANDGIVSSVDSISIGDKLTYGTHIATTYDPNEIWMELSDYACDLRYGMEITLETGVAKNRQQFTGTVIYCDDILPDSLKKGVAYAKLNDPPSASAFMNTSIRANVIDISGVILVPRNAVEPADTDNYVRTIENGKPHKRQVIKGGQNTDVAWIVRGLDENIDVINGR